MKEKIDIKTWKRFKPYTFFSKYSNPYASIITDINVDNIVKYTKKNHVSFYGTFSYLILKAINEIDDFKYVLDNNEVYKCDKVNASFTVLDTNEEINFTRTVQYNKYDEFIKDFDEAKKQAELNEKIQYDNNVNKCYITCLPWIKFSSIDNPVDCNKIDSVPRVCFGKYHLENNEYVINISMQINHAFQDGLHICKFFELLQNNINSFNKNEKE